MTTEEHKDIKSDIDSISSVDLNQIQASTNKKNKLRFLLDAIALLAGGVMIWRSLSSSPESTVEVIYNIDSIRD